MMRIALLILCSLLSYSAFAETESTQPVLPLEPLLHVEKPEIENPWGITTAITVPQPLTLGVERKLDEVNHTSIFVEGGWFKYAFGENKSRSIMDYSIITGIRYRPFADWFTITGELGFRHIGVNVDISNFKMDGQSLANNAHMDLNTYFVGLLVGGEWFLSQRVAIGFDLGFQFSVPIFHGGDVNIVQSADQADGSDLTVDDEDTMKRISSIPIPQIALVRFVWYI